MRATCFHCEPIPERKNWLDPHQYCGRCQPREELMAFDERLVRARLATMFTWGRTGLRRASHINGLIERADVEESLRAAAKAGGLNELETSCLVHRLAGGLDRAMTALEIRNPMTGRHPHIRTISRATASGVRKLTAWLNGARTFEPGDFVEDDLPDPQAQSSVEVT